MKINTETGQVEGAIRLDSQSVYLGDGESAYYIRVWDTEAKRFDRVWESANVTFRDTATDADIAEIIAAEAADIARHALRAAQDRAAKIDRGVRVEILGNGRKTQTDRRSGIETKPVRGDTGAVLWIGQGYAGERRLGIKIDRTGGMVFTGLAVERIDAPAIDEDAINAAALRTATERISFIISKNSVQKVAS